MLLRNHLLPFALLTLSLPGLAAAPTSTQPNTDDQTAAGQKTDQTPTLKAETRAVIVDVVVTKGHDETVPGLKKEDFTVMEDGKPQTVLSFEEHNPIVMAKPVPLPPMPANVFTNVPDAPPADSLNVLLLDGLNTPPQDQSFVRQQVIEFLKSAPAGTPVAVFTLGERLRLVQGFNGNRDLLLAAIEGKKDGLFPQTSHLSHFPQDDADAAEHIAVMQMMLGGFGRSNQGIDGARMAQAESKATQSETRTETTIEALQNLARYLAKIPGRKNLIWFASQFPLQFFPKMNGKGYFDLGVLDNGMKEVADLLTVSRVAIYPVGAHGMDTRTWMEAQNGGAIAGGGNLEASGTARPASGIALTSSLQQQDSESAAEIGAMYELAQETGGEMVHNTNNLAGAVLGAIQNGSHYYTLSYSPSNKNMDGGLRAIQLKLNSGHYKLSYRRGYYALDDTTPRPRHNSSALDNTMFSTAAGATGAVAVPATLDTPPPSLLPLMQHGSPSSTQILYGLRILPLTPQPAETAKRVGANPNLLSLPGPLTRYTLDFMIRWTDVHLEELSSGAHVGEVGVQLIAFDNDGKALNWIGYTMKLNLKPELFAAIKKSGIPAHLEIDVPKGDVNFATGVYDWKTGKAGTLEVPLRSLKVDTALNQLPATPAEKVRK